MTFFLSLNCATSFFLLALYLEFIIITIPAFFNIQPSSLSQIVSHYIKTKPFLFFPAAFLEFISCFSLIIIMSDSTSFALTIISIGLLGLTFFASMMLIQKNLNNLESHFDYKYIPELKRMGIFRVITHAIKSILSLLLIFTSIR